MRVCELMRKITVGSLSIRLWIAADEDQLYEEGEILADELAMLAATMADDEMLPLILAAKLADTLRGLNAVEVLDEHGDGALVYPDWP